MVVAPARSISCPAFLSIDTFPIPLQETDASAASGQNSQGLTLFDKMDTSSLYFRIDMLSAKEGFPNGFSFVTLYQIVLLHAGNVQFNVAFRITFSRKVCNGIRASHEYAHQR